MESVQFMVGMILKNTNGKKRATSIKMSKHT